MPEDLKLSQIGYFQLLLPFRGLHSPRQIILACYFRKSSIPSRVVMLRCLLLHGCFQANDKALHEELQKSYCFLNKRHRLKQNPSPKMKGANWLKFICHQGRSLVNNFSLCNNLYKSVVLSLIWLHSLVRQIHNKQMSQLVAYSGNICVWVVSYNECGGWQLGQCSASIKPQKCHHLFSASLEAALGTVDVE